MEKWGDSGCRTLLITTQRRGIFLQHVNLGAAKLFAVLQGVARRSTPRGRDKGLSGPGMAYSFIPHKDRPRACLFLCPWMGGSLYHVPVIATLVHPCTSVAQSHPCDRDTNASMHVVCCGRMDAQERRMLRGVRSAPSYHLPAWLFRPYPVYPR